MKNLGLMIVLLAAGPLVGGCAGFHLFGAMAQAFEDQKQIEVLPKYDGLEGKTVAVVVDADLAMLYEYPNLVTTVTGGVSARIARDAPDVIVLAPDLVIRWQWATHQWNALPYGEMAEQLNVDRIVYIDIQEYRLNPPGNRWIWDGVCMANVGVIERDNFDPDMFVDTFLVSSAFPDLEGVDRSNASEAQIEQGVLSDFIKRCAWLFHTHLEPKNPERYRPELENPQ
jgi:hypothetical protein